MQNAIVRRLRASGSVFAEDEAAVLITAACDDAELEDLVRRREGGEPLEHIVGRVDFGGLRLAVGPGVFVSRQRSMRLARAAVRAASATPDPVVLEAYAGVAPIAASIAAVLPAAELHVADIDPEALRWARANLPPGAHVHHSDGLSGLPEALRGRLSLIAAVPPYVPDALLRLIPGDRRAHEPERALLGGVDGLHHVRRLIAEAADLLAPGGRVLLEINRRQGPAASAAARRAGYRASYRTAPDGHTAILDLRA